MRIWLCTSEFGDFPGGIATFHNTLSRRLVADGHDVTVFTTSEVPAHAGLVDAPRVVQVAPDLGVLGHAAAASRGMWSALTAHSRLAGAPDVIEVQDYQGLGFFTALGRWTGDELREVPLVVGVHGPKEIISRTEREPRHWMPDAHTRWMESWTMSAADAVIVASRTVSRRLRAGGVLADAEIHVIPHPIASDTAPPPPDGVRDIDLVFVGRMQLTKGIDLLSAALTDVWARRPETTVAVIGSDGRLLPRGESAQAMLRRQHGGRIDNGTLRILGPLPHEEVQRLLARTLVGVVPSRFEAFGYAAIEMLVAGCHVALSPFSGLAEYVTDDPRVAVVDVEQPRAAADQMITSIARAQTWPGLALPLSPRLTEAVDERVAFYRSLQVTRPSRSRSFPGLDRPQVSHRRLRSDDDASGTTLSVAIPHYRLPETVTATVESLAASERLPDEVLIIDDGSADGASERVLDHLAGRTWPFPLSIHRRENRGLAATRNEAAERVSGRYVLFLDADDCVAPRYLGSAVDLLDRYDNVHFVGCWLTYVGDEGPIGVWPTWIPTLPYALVKNPINTAGLVFRRSSFLAAGRNSADMVGGMEDYDALLSLLEAGYRGVAIAEELFDYRIRPDSMSRVLSEEGSAWLYERLAERHPSLYSRWAGEVAALTAQNGRGWSWDNPTWPTPASMGQGELGPDDGIPPHLKDMMRRLWARRWVRTSVVTMDRGRRVRSRLIGRYRRQDR